MGGTFPPTFWTGPSHPRQFANTLQIPRESNAVCEAEDLGRFLQTGAKISAFSFKHEVSSFGARVTGSEAACCRCEPQPTAAEGQGSSGLQQAPAWPQPGSSTPWPAPTPAGVSRDPRCCLGSLAGRASASPSWGTRGCFAPSRLGTGETDEPPKALTTSHPCKTLLCDHTKTTSHHTAPTPGAGFWPRGCDHAPSNTSLSHRVLYWFHWRSRWENPLPGESESRLTETSKHRAQHH